MREGQSGVGAREGGIQRHRLREMQACGFTLSLAPQGRTKSRVRGGSARHQCDGAAEMLLSLQKGLEGRKRDRRERGAADGADGPGAPQVPQHQGFTVHCNKGVAIMIPH